MENKKENNKYNPKIKFYGGTGSVTGANFMLYDNKTKILVDCGMVQGSRINCKDDPNRDDFEYNPADIDFLIVTHGHADHIGRIPKLVKDGFRGKIFSTPTTFEIVKVMFEDALNVITYEAKKCRMEPIYREQDVLNTLALWETIPYHTETNISENFNLYFNDAGHILGSVIANIRHLPTDKNIVFTGDLGNSPTPLIRNAEKINNADYLIIESVYGDRNHEGKTVRKEKLKEILNKVIERKGTLLIPVFSLEKTQVLLHEMNDLIEDGEVPAVPTFFDSPLGLKLTEIYETQFKNFNEQVQARIKSGDDIFDFPKLIKTPDKRDSAEIHKTPSPKIIIASSGMSVGGRILDHEKIYLSDPKNAILFIGYQAIGSLGRDILQKKSVLKIDKMKIPLKAEVLVVNGYSSHMDSDNLVNFVAATKDKVKKVFVVMGEKKSSEFLRDRLINELGVKAVCPELQDEVELD
jgi:metallo-beta-lactamase family protein